MYLVLIPKPLQNGFINHLKSLKIFYGKMLKNKRRILNLFNHKITSKSLNFQAIVKTKINKKESIKSYCSILKQTNVKLFEFLNSHCNQNYNNFKRQITLN